MKKMLTLVLVLGMAAVANAAFTADLAGNNTPGAGAVTLSITEGYDVYMVVTIQGSATLTSALGAAVPVDSAFIGTMADFGLAGTYGNGDVWGMADFGEPYEYLTGVWIDASYTGAVAGDVITAYLTPDGSTFTMLDQITIVPEPVTMALLGLGGLFLRRRK